MKMRDSDIAVLAARTEFEDVALESTFNIAGGAIAGFTVAYVHVEVVDRLGHHGSGTGASVLSIPWGWPESRLTVAERDTRLRELVDGLATGAVGADPADPLSLWRDLELRAEDARLGGPEDESVPALASHLALGAVDNAIHDAWSATAGKAAFDMYTSEHMSDDLSRYLGGQFRGRWAGDYLPPPRTKLPVQHVVGVGDPLIEVGTDRRPLQDWARSDGFRHVKVKLSGASPAADAERVEAVHEVIDSVTGGGSRLALDPNEGYEDMAELWEMVGRLRSSAPNAASAIEYIEQPVPRSQAARSNGLRTDLGGIPVVMDEGLVRLGQLDQLTDDGWQGIVVKAAKGQSLAILCQAFARQHGMYLTVQDLTAVDLALEHSARLAANLGVSAEGFECNSRQYAPSANTRIAATRPHLIEVVDGSVTIEPQTRAGLY